jgi:hypothetical protein
LLKIKGWKGCFNLWKTHRILYSKPFDQSKIKSLLSIILSRFHWLKGVVLTLDCMRKNAWRVCAHCAVREAKGNGRRLWTEILSSWARHWVSLLYL